jgi:hypothetical protein
MGQPTLQGGKVHLNGKNHQISPAEKQKIDQNQFQNTEKVKTSFYKNTIIRKIYQVFREFTKAKAFFSGYAGIRGGW